MKRNFTGGNKAIAIINVNENKQMFTKPNVM